MSVILTSPITGGAQTGFTTPTYTHVTDLSAVPQSRQVVITALGGTQAGVAVHSVALPFTINAIRPANLRVLGNPNPVTGVIREVPINKYTVLTRKGVLPLAGQPNQIMYVRTVIEVPAGADTTDLPSVRAALSAHIGALWQQSAGIGDTAGSGVL
jgi:hypothetical protein